MTLDEAIEHCNDVIEQNECKKCIDEHRQLKEWLEDYKQLKENPPLKFEELEEGMWVWDNDYKLYCLIDRIYSFNKFSVHYHFNTMQEFEENRFFRREVEE